MRTRRHHAPVATASDDRFTLEPKTIDRVSKQLNNLIGLDAERIGRPAIIRGIQAALEKLSADSAGSPVPDTKNPDFQQHLIEAIVVSESWFLREPYVFKYAVEIIKKRLLQQPKVRILSAPCAAGEEAFSLSLSLLDAGVSAEKFQIVAIDISTAAIDSGRQGLFTKNAFRVHAKELQSHWFTKTASGWKIDQLVSQQVQFMQLNLLDEGAVMRLLAKAGNPFDLIYCRNLLIYLNTEARQKTQASLRRLLSTEGEVIVGAAEAVILATDGWRPSGPLAFCKRSPHPPSQPAASASPPASRLQAHQASDTRPAVTKTFGDGNSEKPIFSAPILPTSAAQRLSSAPENKPAPIPVLTQAEQLANAGDIEEAILCCQTALEDNGPEPAVLFMAAMLQQSMGRFVEAERLLEKVVYLKPRHEAALLALALAAGRRGDTALERRYRRSAAIAANHTSP